MGVKTSKLRLILALSRDRQMTVSPGDSRAEVLAAKPRAEATVRVYSLRRPKVWRKGLKRGYGNGIISL